MVSSGESCHKCLWWVVFWVILPNWNGDWFHPQSEYVVTNQYMYVYIYIYVWVNYHDPTVLPHWNHGFYKEIIPKWPDISGSWIIIICPDIYIYIYVYIYIYLFIYIYYSWNNVIYFSWLSWCRKADPTWLGAITWIIPLNVLLIGNDMVTNRGYMVITWWWYGDDMVMIWWIME